MAPHFADAGRLLARVTHAVQRRERVTFLLGSAVTAPGSGVGEWGVPDANAMVEEVARSFRGSEDLPALEAVLAGAKAADRYQEAMKFMLDCRGQDALNELIQKAVLKARIPNDQERRDPEALELDTAGWHLRPATRAIGQLITEHPGVFSEPLLTSNFDPLIEVSIRAAGGLPAAIFLAADGLFSNVLAPGASQVVHFHGYWRGSDTLHTPGQLTRNRPHLKGSLRNLLRESTLVVMAYGGWSDVFTRTLVEVIGEQTEALNVLWCFYSDDDDAIQSSNALLIEQFEPLAGQRVMFYKGVDCHVFLPRLRQKLQPPKVVIESVTSPTESQSPVAISIAEGTSQPPQSVAWVGREAELRMMLSSAATVIGITGIGGNGKSTLAAKYLEQKRGAEEVRRWCWVDCREQGNTLHTQIVRTIEQISEGDVRGSQLEQSDAENLLEVLFNVIGSDRILIVFDNIDQYVDVVECAPVGIMSRLIVLALKRSHNAQFVITGRPKLVYDDPRFLHVELAGLSIEETRKLFEIVGVRIDPLRATEKIATVHELTAGHALALNLIATQVAKNKADFDELLRKLRTGIEAGIENPILPNIWETLNAKQQMVLRYLAEIVHPQSEQRIASYFGSALNYNQFSKAIRALKSLNLVVVKSPGGDTADTLELHPLIRDFIRRRFQKEERAPYIESILRFCDRMILKFRRTMLTAPWSILEHWTSKVELCLESDLLEEALAVLLEVHNPLVRGGYGEEFVRLGLQILKRYDVTPDEKDIGNYDRLCRELVEILSQLGRYAEADMLLQDFETTVQGKSARYVLLCEMRTYSFWLRQEFDQAKRWALEGVELKATGHIDTQHDCSHNLALAQRDSGEVEAALKYFLAGEKLETILDVGNLQPGRGGQFYGNIGRCLQLQRRYEDALICLRKSARLLEDDKNTIAAMNAGWAAFWLGEALEMIGKAEDSFTAFQRAASKWKRISPSRAQLAVDGAGRVREKVPSDATLPTTQWEIDRAFTSWLKN